MRRLVPSSTMSTLVVGLTAWLAGCAVGPNYHAPPAPAGAQAPFASVTPGLENVEPLPQAWWRLYQDARLDAYVEEAFRANTDLRAADANLTAARAVLLEAQAGRYPQSGAEFSVTRGRDAVTEEILELNGHPPQTVTIFGALLDASYELDLFGRVRRTVEAAHADAQAVAAVRDVVRVTVAAETARAYAEICSLAEELAVAHRSVEVVSRETEITRKRYEAGGGSQFDVVRSEELVAQVRAAIPSLEGQRRAALFQLTALLGRTPSNAPHEAEQCAGPLKLATLVPVGDGEALLKRRPDVREAERRLAAATARIGVATADLYPHITLTAFGGGVGFKFSQLTTNNALASGVGPGITWAFPDPAGRARLRESKADTAAALAGFDGTILQALKETEQALTLYAADLARRQDLVEAQSKAEQAYEMAHGQFGAGAVSSLDLLTSEQTLVSASAATAASDTALLQDQIGLFKALGGGWE